MESLQIDVSKLTIVMHQFLIIALAATHGGRSTSDDVLRRAAEAIRDCTRCLEKIAHDAAQPTPARKQKRRRIKKDFSDSEDPTPTESIDATKSEPDDNSVKGGTPCVPDLTLADAPRRASSRHRKQPRRTAPGGEVCAAMRPPHFDASRPSPLRTDPTCTFPHTFYAHRARIPPHLRFPSQPRAPSIRAAHDPYG